MAIDQTLQLQATFTITDPGHVIAAAKARAQSDGGDPTMIDTPGDALIELFNLLDDEGNAFTLLPGVELEELATVTLCSNPDCGRKQHR